MSRILLQNVNVMQQGFKFHWIFTNKKFQELQFSDWVSESSTQEANKYFLQQNIVFIQK